MAEPPEKKARAEGGANTFKVAYPGEEGSLAHSAAVRFVQTSPKAELCGVESFAEAFNALSNGKALYACVPIENSASGSIAQTYDLIFEHDVVVGGELGVRESYNLCAKEGTTLASARYVLSHPNILDACSSYVQAKLADHAEMVPTRSSTDATRRVAGTEEKPHSVAISTRESAVRNGLKILASNIGNHTVLETRYVLLHLAKGPAAHMMSPFPRDVVSPTRKQSAMFVVNDQPGSLFKLMACWGMRNVSISRMETRPLKVGNKMPAGIVHGHLWDFLIFIDYDEPPGQTKEQTDHLWAALTEFSTWQRHYGSYPSQTSRSVKKQTQSWDDMIDLMTK